MSQLQVTGEAKIRDLQGPVVANAGVITALDGLPSQYVRGDGTLADIPSVTGGGSSVSYYLNGSVSQGTISGSTYYQLGENAITGVGTNFSTSANGLIAQFITDVNVPDQTEIPSGNWNVEFFMGVSASSGALASFYVEIYKYDGSTFTLIGSNAATPEYLTNTTTIDAYFTSVAMPLTALAQTDRIAVRVFVNVAGKTVTLYTEDNRLCQVVTTFSRGILSMNSLTDQQQYLTVGTAGTDFNIVSSVDTHTFNIPSASATNRGLITTGTQTIAGNKTLNGLTDFQSSAFFGQGLFLTKNAVPSTFYSGSLSIYSGISATNNIIISDNTKSSQFILNSTADRTYTFSDLSGTIALLEGTQTFTGSKTFNNGVVLESGALLKQNVGGSTGSGYTTLYSSTETGFFKLNILNGTSLIDAELKFQNSGDWSYIFPAASGTVALTSNLSAYLPLSGGTLTGTLNGTFGIFSNLVSAFGFTADGGVSNAGQIQLKHTGSIFTTSGYVTIGADSANTIGFYFSGSSTAKFSNASLTATRTYTLPDASGTLALTSDLGSYVTLSTAQNISGFKTFTALATNNEAVGIKLTTGVVSTNGYLTLNSKVVGTLHSLILAPDSTTNRAEFTFDNTALRTYTLPNASGTIALTSNIPTVSGTSGQVTYFNGTSSVTGSSNHFWDATNNRLGIGLTNPQRSLEIYSATADSHLRLSGSAPSVSLGEAITGSIYQAKFGLATAAGQYASGAVAGDFVIISQTGATIFATSSTEKMRLTSDGLLLLGTTSSTGELLQVAGTAKFTGALSGTSATFSGGIQASSFSSIGSVSGYQIYRRDTNAYAGAWYSATGNISLDMAAGVGNALSFTYGTGAATFSSSVTAGGSIETTGSYFLNGNAYFGKASSIISGGSVNDGAIMVSGSNNLLFGIALSEKMRITSAGSLLVGTSAIFASGLVCSDGGTSYTPFSARVGTTANAGQMYFLNPNGIVGSITTNGSVTSYNITSDYRLKQDLQDFNSLNLLSKIKIYDYQWKSDNSRMHGVMAHELQEIIPYAVNGEKDGENMQQVDYSKLVPVLVKSIQELEARIKQLENL